MIKMILENSNTSLAGSDVLDDKDDEIILQSEDQSEQMINEMFKMMKGTFGMHVTKSIILKEQR